MFGQNEIVGRKYFQETPDEEFHQLLVTSMFLTLQGEGPFSGRPAFFLRLAKCNLNCSFCDTYFDTGDWFTISDLHDLICEKIKDYQHDLVLVITGGEPTLQPALRPFLERMSFDAHFSHIQIESNGILHQHIPNDVTLVISPKCAEIDHKPTHYIKPHRQNLARADCLKFVLSADPNSPYHTIPDWALEQETGRPTIRDDARGLCIPIYVSPMNCYLRHPKNKGMSSVLPGRALNLEERSTEERISWWESGLLDMEQNKKNHEYAAQYCMDHGLILSLQTHLYASLP
jgi:7-carboxy-7-deazaguanine synthase